MASLDVRHSSSTRSLVGAILSPLVVAFALGCNDSGTDLEEPASPTPVAEETPVPRPDTPTPALTPEPEPTPEPTPLPQVDVTPLAEPFEVRAAEAINVRAGPSTGTGLLSTLFPGETARVIGEASGEAVEPGETTWYQVEFTREEATVHGFLYAQYVERVP